MDVSCKQLRVVNTGFQEYQFDLPSDEVSIDYLEDNRIGLSKRFECLTPDDQLQMQNEFDCYIVSSNEDADNFEASHFDDYAYVILIRK